MTVASPETRTIRNHAEFTGRFEAVDHVDIEAQVTGYLQSVAFEDGEHVERGDLLFVIDPRPFEADVANAEAEVARARSALELAEMDAQRGERLFDSDAISREEVETRRANRDMAAGDLAAARAALQEAELKLDYTRIKSPVTGKVSNRQVDTGNLVRANGSSRTLTTIVTEDPIHFVFDVSESTWLDWQRQTSDTAASTIEPGQSVQLHLSGESGWTYDGELDFIDNRLDGETGTLRMRAEVDNPDGQLQPGLFGRLRIATSAPYEVLLVPDAAIRTDQATHTVSVVNANDVVETRQVETGGLRGDLRVVTSGLKADARVIVGGGLRVSSGDPVKPTTRDDNDAESTGDRS